MDWITYYGIEHVSASKQYFISLYWAITTYI